MVVDVDGDGDEARNRGVRRPTGGMLSFQRLDVYRCAIEFLACSTALPQNLPKGYSSLAEQLRRAALSVPLNIAEGAGRVSEADGARHYAIARGSAMECAAIVDALRVLSVVDEEEYERTNELLARIVAMLTKMCR
ncbi:MAG TPA: four helix bundle protein [Polyangiaceae bacterium]